ncbi:S-layer homology domain-containing protein [Candidatus Peregrinibacteria bacterium]|nr:MAG: S-layer homology domain-containing protein [Candidatus Peregrinibacteria bacterium]
MKNLRYVLPFFVLLLTPDFAQAVELGHGLIKQYSYETEHYRIEFSELLMEQADEDGNDLPDIVDIVAESAEYAYGVLIEDLHYPDPMEEGELLLIVLDDTDQYLASGSLGVTSLLSNGDPYVALDPWLSEEYLQVTTGHEIFHTVQFGYGVSFAYTYPGINWAEATATWVEDLQYDSINDYVNYLADFFDYPDYSIFASFVPTGSLFEYGLNIWPRFLSEYYNDNVVKEIWEAYIASEVEYESDLRLYETVRSVVAARGDEFNEVFRQFTLWNLSLEPYEEGNLYPSVLLLEGETGTDYQQLDSNYAPALYGSNYIYFENTGSDSSFYFHIQKPENIRFAVTLVPYDEQGANLLRSTSQTIGPDEVMEEALELSDLSGVEGVVAVISPLDAEASQLNGVTDFDEGHLYNFWAEFGAPNAQVEVETTHTDEDAGTKEGEISSSDKGELNTLVLSVISYDEDSVSLDWNRLVRDSVFSYEVHYGTEDDDLEFTQVIPHAYTTSATISGLEAGETYYFELETYNENGVAIVDASSIIAVTPEAWIFSDVSYLHSRYAEIHALVEGGVFQGYADGSFKPEVTINRAELLKILIEGRGYTPGAHYNNCFSDVGTAWYAKYVCYAKEEGWVNGYADGSFKPGEPVNKVEALKMLFNVYEAGLQEGTVTEELPYEDLNSHAWYSIYVSEASELGILEEEPGTVFEATEGRSRSEMAVELYRYLVVMDLIRE